MQHQLNVKSSITLKQDIKEAKRYSCNILSFGWEAVRLASHLKDVSIKCVKVGNM